jgi:virginiamycin B lyase
VRRWLSWFVAAGTAGLVAGTVGELVSAWAPAGWSAASLGTVLSGSAGRWWEVRLSAAAVVLAGRKWSWPGPVGAALAAYTFAATSHGAAAAHVNAGLGFEYAHILAVTVWLGGAAVVAGVWAATRRAVTGGRRTLLHRYSVTAGIAVPMVIASGLGNALLEVGRLGDLTTSAYGRSLLLKLAAVVTLLAVAAVNAVLLRPALEAGRQRGRRLDRMIAIEAGLGLAVLIPTAVLAVLAPSRPSDAARAAAARVQAAEDPAHAFSGSTQLGGRETQLSVTPAAVGVNAVRAEVSGVDAAAQLRIVVSGRGRPRSAELNRSGYDHDSGMHTTYEGSLQLDGDGTWQAVLQSPGFSGSSVPIVMPVSARAPGNAANPGEPGSWLALLALIGSAAALLAATRGVQARWVRAAGRVLAAGGAVAALTWAGTLTIGATGRPAPAAGWGRVRSAPLLAAAGARVWRLPRGVGPMMPAVGPDGSVWIAEMNVNKLARLDPRNDAVQEFRFPGAYRETMGIAVAADGRVWVAQEHAMALGMFDPSAGRYREFAIPGVVSAPVGIAVAPGGAVWFTEMSGNRIGRFEPSTGRFTEYTIPTANAAPYWLAVGPDGRVWFSEFAAGQIGMLDPRSGRIREYAMPDHPNLPAVAVAKDGAVWATSTQGTLYRLTPSSGAVRSIALPASGDYGVAIAPDGELWVGRNGGSTLFVVQPDTGQVRGRRLPAGSAPWWPAVDADGHVWVALAGLARNGLAELGD